MTTISGHTSRAAGTILTATIYNTDHNNHVTNAQNLNNDKVEGATPPVVDGHAAVFDGTGGASLKSAGHAPMNPTNNLSDVDDASASYDNLVSGLTSVSAAPTDQVTILDASDSDAPKLADVSTLGVGKQTIWIPASAMIAATTNGPASAQIETSSEAINISVLDFDASTDEYAHFQIAMPKGWDEGTLTYRVFWTTEATDTDGVAWALQAVGRPDNGGLDQSFGTAIVVTDDATGSAEDLLITSESSALTVSFAGADRLTNFRLFRDVSDGNDDMAEDARLIGIQLFYTTDANTDD